MTRPIPVFLLLSLFLLTGCPSPERDDQPGIQEPSPDHEVLDQAPRQKQDSLRIEGQAEAVTLELFSDQTVPATTYYPSGDFEPEVASSSTGTAVHFTATFGGVRTENATLRLFFPRPNSNLDDPAQLQSLVEEPDGLADVEGFRISSVSDATPCLRPEYAWQIQPEDGQTGFMCISSRQGQWFLVIASYPLEMAEGFEPRAVIILRELTLRDSDSEASN